MMSTIAGSIMSLVGVTFSMILVVLALASSQYISRILRNFMRSRVTQVVLGALQTIAGLTTRPDRRRALGDQVRWITELADRTLDSTHDREQIEAHLSRLSIILEA
jgi:uncharacterized membrane protein